MKRVGRFEIQGEIARGGGGTVYRARDPDLQRDVAIKVLHGAESASADSRRRFAREARTLARLSHPHVLKVHGAEVEDGVPYLIFDLVAGENLADRLDRERFLPLREAAEIAKKLANGLTHCHEHGVLHRDVKPENVIQTPDGAPLLVDFGLAKDLLSGSGDLSLTQGGTIMGTPGFWSPEQAAGRVNEVDERTDVYSLGATLYALLTGEAPFTGKSLMELAIATQEQPPESVTTLRPDAPDDLNAIVQRCLAKARGDRYSSASALEADLERHLAGRRISGVAPVANRRTLRVVVLGAGLVGAALVGASALSPSKPAPVVPAVRPATPQPSQAAAAPTWGWRLEAGERVDLWVQVQVGVVTPTVETYECDMRVEEVLSQGRVRLGGSIRRASRVLVGLGPRVEFDTQRPLEQHALAGQPVLRKLFAQVGRPLTITLGPTFADIAVSGLGARPPASAST